jgi:hypothetical protein
VRPVFAAAASGGRRLRDVDGEDEVDLLAHGLDGRHEALPVGVREEEQLHRVAVVDGDAAAADLHILLRHCYDCYFFLIKIGGFI